MMKSLIKIHPITNYISLISGEETAITDQPYRYLTVDEMKSLGDDSLPIDVTRDERADNKMHQSNDSAIMNTSYPPQALEDSISPHHISTYGNDAADGYTSGNADNIIIDRHPQHIGWVGSAKNHL